MSERTERYPLRGKEAEILAKRETGKSEYQLAVEYAVYPNAIRQAIKRARAMRELVSAGK